MTLKNEEAVMYDFVFVVYVFVCVCCAVPVSGAFADYVICPLAETVHVLAEYRLFVLLTAYRCSV